MKRQEVIWELCETETTFVDGLRSVIRLFSLPLRTPQGRWIKGIPTPISRLFDWLDDIIHVHSEIQDTFEAMRTEQRPIVIHIASILLSHIQKLEVHQPYLVRFEMVTKLIEGMVEDESSDFGEFVRIQSNSPECGSMTLTSFLLKPVQRLMKYPLFFKQLCELTPPSHPDHRATLTLLQVTDSIIKIMQEVKAREEEYEELKVLQTRIRGLPADFVLARRDRRLLCHGLLRRVHISYKDRAALEGDTASGIYPSKPQLSSLHKLNPKAVATTTSLTTSFDESRPVSYASEFSEVSAKPAPPGQMKPSFWSKMMATGITASSTESSLRPFSMASSNISSQFRPDSVASSTFSNVSDASLISASSASSYGMPHLKARNGARLIRTKAKESPLHTFVFSDMILFATRHTDGIRLIRSTKGNLKKREQSTYKLVDGFGLCRVLGFNDLSGRTEHDHLIQIDVLPIQTPDDPTSPLAITHASLATSVFLTIPRSLSARNAGIRNRECLFQERQKWVKAFERSYLHVVRSLSFLSPTNKLPSSQTARTINPDDRTSIASIVAAGLPIPKSPSQQSLERGHFSGPNQDSEDQELDKKREREERGWWAMRLKKVRDEMMRDDGALLESQFFSFVGGAISVPAVSVVPTSNKVSVPSKLSTIIGSEDDSNSTVDQDSDSRFRLSKSSSKKSLRTRQ
ncbi:Dbl homology domain-containing protein [Atractiella rhizophila]|nr:Dbl homology domain-containing protein [Atractiella rhizophila]